MFDLYSWKLWALLLVALIVYLIILKPLVPLILLKIKLGKDVEVYFFPILGHRYWNISGEKNHGDPYYYLSEIRKRNPTCKALLTNYLTCPHVIFYQPCYARQLLQGKLPNISYQNITSTRDLSWYQFQDCLKKDQYSQILKVGGFKGCSLKCIVRKLLSQSFTFESIFNRTKILRGVIQDAIGEMKENTDFDALLFGTKIAGEVVIRTFFGKSFGESIINGQNASIEVQELINDSIFLLFDPFFSLKFSLLKDRAAHVLQSKKEKEILTRVEGLRKKASEVIDIRIQQKSNGETNKEALGDFLDVYLDRPEPITAQLKEEMIQQFITFFFAGTDTSSHLVLWTLYHLSIDQQLQEEIREEVKQHYSEQSQMEDFNKLVKLQALINEVLRVSFFTDFLLPRIALETSTFLDITIPKGWYVNMSGRFIFTNPTQYQGGQQFDVTRWFKEDDQVLSSDPLKGVFFSAFGRNCIGKHLALAEAKVIFCELLLKFRVIPALKNPKKILKFIVEFEDNHIVQFQKL